MTIYTVVILQIHDNAKYEPYIAGIAKVWQKYNGTMLAVDDEPTLIEGGHWPNDRTVVMSWPDEDAFRAWYYSPEYQELVKHRHAASTGTMILLKAFDPSLFQTAENGENVSQ